MTKQITIDKETARMISDFLSKHGYEWCRFYDERTKGKAHVFDIHYELSSEAGRVLHETINLLTEEGTHEGSHSRQHQSPAQAELPE